MNQIKILFYLFILLFSNFLLGQTQKELNKMNYEGLKTAFFENENNATKQKVYAKEYLSRAKNDKDQSKIPYGYFYYSLTVDDLNIAIKYLDTIILKTKPDNIDLNFPTADTIKKGFFMKSCLIIMKLLKIIYWQKNLRYNQKILISILFVNTL